MRIPDKYLFPFLSLLAIAVFAPLFLSLEPSIMEARNLITAREMIQDDNWIMTTMNGEARYQKPPLPTWITAIMMYLFGAENLLALRIPGLIMLALCGVAAYRFSLLFEFNHSQAFINAGICMSSFYVFAIIVEAPWDIFAHGFMFLGIYYLFRLFQTTEKYWPFTIISGICIGLSILSKGPVSLYALFLPFLIAYGLTFGFKGNRSKAFSLFSVACIALILGGWWYLYVRYQDPATFKLMAQAETGNWSSYNVRPIYYYWSFFIQTGIWTIFALMSLMYPYLKNKVDQPKFYKLTFWWTILSLILLSLIPEKKSRYLMPLLLPLALNIGFYVRFLMNHFGRLKQLERLPVYFHFGLMTVVCLGLPILGYWVMKDYEVPAWFWLIIASAGALIMGFLIMKFLWQKKISILIYANIGLMVLLLSVFIPSLGSGGQAKSQSGADQLRSLADRGIEIYDLDGTHPEFIWASGNKIKVLKDENAIDKLPVTEEMGVLTSVLSSQDFSKMLGRFNIVSSITIDLNPSTALGKKRDRLIKQLYHLQPK